MKKQCEVEECTTEIPWGHFCEMHRSRMRRHGDPTMVVRFWHMTRAVRLEAYTDRSAGPDGCWPWTRAKNESGYGVIAARDGGTAIASRAAFEVAHNVTLTRDVDVMHLCNNPPCCNPAHLRVGSRAENQEYMATTGRSAHGVRNGNAKLTEAQVTELRRLRVDGMKIAELVTMFGISQAQVSRIANGQRRSRG